MHPHVAAGLYLSGSIGIVILTLLFGWFIVWKFILRKHPFIQELFELNRGPIPSERYFIIIDIKSTLVISIENSLENEN